MLTNLSSPCHPLSPFAEVRGYRKAFSFELLVQPSWAQWWRLNWTLSFVFAAVYLGAVVVGQRLMRDRLAFRLRHSLLAWNTLVAMYSLLTGGRVATEILAHLGREGFLASLCALGPMEHQQVLGTYLVIFAISKVVELIDTMFLVLRRKPVTFLHCFHHAGILMVTWAYTAYPSVVGAYFMAMNQAVHFLLYSYLALRVLRVPTPAVTVPLLAILELLQVVAGFALTAYAARAKRAGTSCCLYAETMDMIFVAYGAFVVVFSKMLLDVVLRRWTARKEKAA